MDRFPQTGQADRCQRVNGRESDRFDGQYGGLTRMGSGTARASKRERRLKDSQKKSNQKFEMVRQAHRQACH